MTIRTLRALAATVGLPIAIAVACWAITRSFLSELPDPVATHWGAGSEPDDFQARNSAGLTTALLAGVLGAVIGLGLWVAFRKASMVARGAGALAGGLSGLVGAVGVGTLWIQRGLSDARAATDIDTPMGIAFAVGLACAVLGAVVMSGEVPGAARATGPVPPDAPRLPLGESERALWLGWAHSPAMLYVAIGSVVLPLAVLAILGISTLPILAVLAATAILMVCMSTFRVSANDDGLRVRSIAGWPRFHVPLSDVVEAEVVEVAPMREFGGWGLRGDLKGRFGVILRKGPALEVCRGDGSRFLVTVDGAAEAAALLNALADRARQRSAAA